MVIYNFLNLSRANVAQSSQKSLSSSLFWLRASHSHYRRFPYAHTRSLHVSFATLQVKQARKQDEKHHNGNSNQRCKTKYLGNNWFFGYPNSVHTDLGSHIQRIQLPDWDRRESVHTYILRFPSVQSNVSQTSALSYNFSFNKWNNPLGFYDLLSNFPSNTCARRRTFLHPFGIRTFVTSSHLKDQIKTSKPSEVLRAEEKSRVEEAVEAIKEKKQLVKDKAFQYGCSPEDLLPKVEPKVKTSLWEKIKHEAKHYYNGFKLLYFETKIAVRLLWQVLNGKSLTRRQRRQFLRTAADLFRLVPFLVFLVIPFMEFLLPVVVKVFPNLLPSTFEDKSKREETQRKQLKVKIEMAKFLQDTVEEMAVTAKQTKSQKAVVEFASFFEKIRTKGEQPSNEDIIRFSKLFEDEITLDNMSRGQLKAINRLLLLQTIGTDNYLRFQLRMKLRQLRMDDLMIKKEGVDALTVQELQSACQARGMRAIGVPEARLRSQLKQWLELHLEEQVPISLLLMSRALYLPENISTVDKLKETLSKLPEILVEETEIKVAELSGEEVDNKRRLELLKKEEEIIAAEKEEEEIEKRKRAEAEAAEILVDHAEVIHPEEISKEDWLTLKGGIANEREVLTKIKEDREEYREELKELEIEDEDHALSESLGSTRLGKKVDNMISKIEKRLQQLEEELIENPEALRIDADGDGKITTEELIKAIQKLQNAPSEAKCRKIADMLDQDKDGALDLDDVETVIELLCIEDVDLTAEQVSEIVSLITRENDARDEAKSAKNSTVLDEKDDDVKMKATQES